MVTLEQWGFDAGWAQALAESAAAGGRLHGVIAARVVRQHKGAYGIVTVFGHESAVLAGRLRHHARASAALPCVGDWVAVGRAPPALPVIHAVLARRNKFSRRAAGQVDAEQVVAANIDTLFLVSGLDGDFNPRRIERYLALASDSGAVPVVVLNKSDLCPDVAAVQGALSGIAERAAVHLTQAFAPHTLAPLGAYLRPGTTAALLGSSGVGKSTLLNALLGEERARTGAVSEVDSRGRHVTTHRELFLSPQGGAIIDTPGLREVQFWREEAISSAAAFADIVQLAAGCRFTDCRHEQEPACAVQQAVQAGELSHARLASFQKLRREEAQARRRTGKR